MSHGVALVTGVAHGIGASTAQALARSGYEVHGVDVDTDYGEQTISLIVEAGGQATFHPADLAAPDGPRLAVERILGATNGRLHALINNAFRFEPGREALDLSSEEWEADLRFLFLSYLEVIRAAVDALGPGASIVNLASVRGTYAGGGFASYSVAKAAVAQLTRTLAVELGPRGVRVNAVAPGIIATRRTQKAALSVRRRYEAITPLQRLGEPDDVADVIAFLVSDAARFVTGHVLTVDGGLTLALQSDAANAAVTSSE
jgi:NAD(P)-dependent dehydrogenase (short-subunit alcohol dehydrogenase family)